MLSRITRSKLISAVISVPTKGSHANGDIVNFPRKLTRGGGPWRKPGADPSDKEILHFSANVRAPTLDVWSDSTRLTRIAPKLIGTESQYQ
jgi:hypothetical protein